MIRWDSVVFIRFSLWFAAGILLYQQGWHLPAAGYVIAALCGLYILLHRFSSKRFKSTHHYIFGFVAALLLASSGNYMALLRDGRSQPAHLLNLPLAEVQAFTGTLAEPLQQRARSYRTILQVQQVKTETGWQQASGLVQIYFSARDSLPLPRAGDVLLAVGAPEPVSPPANPGEFDYRAFLANRQIHFRKFLNHKDYTIAGQQPLNYLLAHAQKLREHFRAVLQKHIPGRDENSVALALVLGIKDQLGRQLQATYAGAGAMHVLAVSGLHVGIIFMLFQFLLQAFGKRAASSPAARLLVILVLFAYAFITGLSASVVRAATMFSLMQLGGMLGRKGNTHNTVAFSAFLLLCWNPFYLFEVGFQLSYLAVFGIVYLQPKIALLWQPAGRARIFLRDLLSVSVAAQIATFPLGLLYFNQFPVYFLLSNLVVINAAGLLLLSCIVLLGLSFIPVVPAIALAGLGKVIAWCIWLQNMLLQVIVELPGAVASDIYITPPEAWLIYATILALAALFATRRFYWLTTTFILVLLLVATGLHRQWQQQQQTELVIYSTGGQVAIGLLKGQAALLLAEGNLLQDQQKLDYHIAPHLLQRGIKHLTKQPVEHAGQAGIIGRCTPAGNLLLRFRDKNLLVLTEKNTDPALRLADYVVLAKAVNLAASTAHLGNTQIVLASNSRYQQRKLSTLLQDSNTNVQAVQLQQALVLNW